MASLFGALGSLAESYGQARQNVEESNLRRVQQQIEQTRLQMEQAQAKREEAYKPLMDIGLPPFTDPITKQLTYQRWSPTEGKIVNFASPGGGNVLEGLKQYIGQQDPGDRTHLAEYAQALSSTGDSDPRDVASRVMALGETLAGKRETQQAEVEKEARSQQAQREKEARATVEWNRRRRELEPFLEKMQGVRLLQGQRLSRTLLQTRENTASIKTTLEAIDVVIKNGGVLNSLLSAGKIDLAVDGQGFWSSVISRGSQLTDQEKDIAAAFQRLTEGVNVLRGPLGATGFRGPEAFGALQAQRGKPMADPGVTLRVLANTRQYLKQLQSINEVQLQGTIQQIQDLNQQQQAPIILNLGPPE